MAKFKIPVTWEVCGVVEVESETLEDAVRYFEENSDNIPLPSDSEYVDGSFGLSCNDIDFIKTFNQQERNGPSYRQKHINSRTHRYRMRKRTKKQGY